MCMPYASAYSTASAPSRRVLQTPMLLLHDSHRDSHLPQAVIQFMTSFDSDMSGTIELDEWRTFIEKAWAANRPVATRFVKTLRYKLKRKRAAERAEAAAIKQTKQYY